MKRVPAAEGGRRRRSFRPTRHGLLWIGMLAAFLVAAANYSNNAAYLFFFLMTSVTLVALLQARRNLGAPEILEITAESGFAGGEVRCSFSLYNPGPRPVHAFFVAGDGHFHGPFDAPASGRLEGTFTLAAPRRGRFRLRWIEVGSVHPLGLWLVRRSVAVDVEYWVYPRPEGRKAWPVESAAAAESEAYSQEAGGDDFSGYRNYRPGESLHHLDWKAYARGRSLLVKEFNGGGCGAVWLDWQELAGFDDEHRLSQLARWVLGADRLGCDFGLKLPHYTIAPDSGSLHTQHCLQALACYPEKP